MGEGHGTPLWVYLIAIVPPLAATAAAFAQPWVEARALLRDPLTHAGGLWYFGLVSNLGILAWCTGAAICLFVSFWLSRVSCDNGRALYMLVAGLLTGMLMLDDFFLLHEQVYPSLGVSEAGIVLLYGLAVIAYICIGWKYMAGTDVPLFLAGLCLFVVSALTDLLFVEAAEWKRFLEDASKLTGIGAWTIFHIRAAWMFVTRDLSIAASSP